MNGDEGLMRVALELAARGLEENEMPIGAVVALDGNVLASAYWRFRPDALLDHAELVALRKVQREPSIRGRRRELTLYTTLEPCLLCMGAAMSALVRRVVFALESPVDGASDVPGLWQPRLGHPRDGQGVYAVPEIAGAVCRDESLALMKAWVEQNPDIPWARAFLPIDLEAAR